MTDTAGPTSEIVTDNAIHGAAPVRSMDYLGSFVGTGNPNSMGYPRPEWPQRSNAVGEPKVIVFDANLFTYEIGEENTTAMDNYSADIQAARALFPTAGLVFDYFGLKP